MEPFIGQIMLFAGNFAPRNWAFCDGRLLPIAQYSALYSLLGTTYGGDGRTSFGLPDLRGRIPIGTGNGPGLIPRELGAKGGFERVPLTSSQMPSHSHGASLTASGCMMCDTGSGSEKSPKGNSLANSQLDFYSEEAPTSEMNESSVKVTGSVEIGQTGQNEPHENMQPYQAINYCIALEGIYPSRS